MDTSGNQLPILKPPWEKIQFQSSAYPNDAVLASLATVRFDLSWNEITHPDLTAVKAKIEPLEASHKWEQLKKRTNPYELIYTQENTDCPPSLSLLKPLSRSYFKMVELLQVSKFFERLPKTVAKLRSAHVAEGPGGFIEAFIYGAEVCRMKASKCFAMTLKPTNNHVPGWRRSYNFLQKHPEIKIHYGEDGTGDLYVPQNQTSFVKLIDSQKVYLYTGDGGFDFSVDYENQEKSVFLLLVASAIVGLQVLASDGTFILKLFDLFSPSTQYLLRLITFCFKDWTLYKPATSRPCNSERYLICRGFRRAYPAVIRALQTIQENHTLYQTFPNPDFFSLFNEKEKEFLEQHISDFNKAQIENIEKTIAWATADTSTFSWKQQYILAQHWCNVFHIPTLNLKAVLNQS